MRGEAPVKFQGQRMPARKPREESAWCCPDQTPTVRLVRDTDTGPLGDAAPGRWTGRTCRAVATDATLRLHGQYAGSALRKRGTLAAGVIESAHPPTPQEMEKNR